MAWTTPATPVTLTVITVAFYNVNIRDNLNQLRANTGSADPGAAGLSLESDTATSAAWVGGKVARAGDTMTGPLTVPTGQGNGVNFGGSQIYEVGPGAGLLAKCAGNIFYVFTGNLLAEILRATYGGDLLFMGNKVWHEGNDGAASTLDSDLLDGQQGTFYQARTNHTGTQAPATISPQGSGSGLNADQLDSIDSSGFIKVDGTAQTITANKTFTLPGGATMDWGTSVGAGGGVKIVGSFTATGLKAAAVTGPDKKLHSFAATEATRMYFEDYGTAQLKDGFAYVEIPEDFRYYVDTEHDYYIWLTPYGDGHPWIASKTPEAFIIGCSHDLRVDWRVTALRKDINQERLALIEPDNTASD